MDIVEAILSVSAALETVPTYGSQNCRTMANCVDTLHNIASAIQTARAPKQAGSKEKEGKAE